MIMNEVKINVPEGYEIDKENSTFELIKFKKIEKLLPNSWKELRGVNGYYVDTDSNVERALDCYTEKGNKNIFRTEKQAEAVLALAQLSQLMYVYNEGWEPDWKNTNYYKYVIYFYYDEVVLSFFDNHQHFLAFKTKKIRDLFYENFKDLIEIAKPLL